VFLGVLSKPERIMREKRQPSIFPTLSLWAVN